MDTFKHAAVIGAGTMGAGISVALAKAGISVLLKEEGVMKCDEGVVRIGRLCSESVARGKMTVSEARNIAKLITPTVSYGRFTEADLVIEAVHEDVALKREVFQQVGVVTRPGCVLTTNTSTLDLDTLAVASSRPEMFAGLHFFCPAHVMRLIEIVRGRHTDPDTIASCLRFAEQLGKVGVVVGNCFGFVANSMLMHYMHEAYKLVEEGCSVIQVDEALTNFGMPMGPYRLQDLVGLDVGVRIRRDLRAQGRTMVEGADSRLPDRVCALGRYGKKVGAGWYRYENSPWDERSSETIDAIASEEANRLGIHRRTIEMEEIVGRTICALINQGARLLEGGYVESALDIDRIFLHGFGFPAKLGGPMRYADSIGLPVVLGRISSYAESYGGHWRPAGLLERLVTARRTFYGQSSLYLEIDTSPKA